MHGDVLDNAFMASLADADIVYSWGVLHHTGQMWRGMDNAISKLKADGSAYFALYDHDIHVNPTPEYWLAVKQKYNAANWQGKRALEAWYVWTFMLRGRVRNLPELLDTIKHYKNSRGMEAYTDLVDWLGGWPMEFAKREDVGRWAESHNLRITRMNTGEANTEYRFARDQREAK